MRRVALVALIFLAFAPVAHAGQGAQRLTLTLDAGEESASSVTALVLTLTGPRVARYAQRVTLHASVSPRVRVLGTTPWVAHALGVASPVVRILVAPKIVDTRSAHIAQVRIASRPAAGWVAAHAAVSAEIVVHAGKISLIVATSTGATSVYSPAAYGSAVYVYS